VLMVRETPLHLVHLRNMLAVTEAGAIVMPPVPAFYAKPATIAEMVTASVARALDLLDIDTGALPRWGEDLAIGGSRGRSGLA
jgi:4-hydroxy-3-polyprenylbenzoate decarboxylase